MNFESPKKETSELSISGALAQISLIEQQVMGMGANDYEPSAFKQICNQLASGKMTPSEALLAAKSILDNKMDYH